MRTISAILLIILIVSCSRDYKSPVTHEEVKPATLLSTTPVKNQGNMEACWLYAYLACVETERIEQYGDSLNLSPLWLERAFFKEQAIESYLTKGAWKVSMRNVGPEAERLLATYGMVPWNNYKYDDLNSRVISRDIYNKVKVAVNSQTGLSRLEKTVEESLPRFPHNLKDGFYLYSMHYTPQEFGRSIMQGVTFNWITSYTHHPYGRPFVLEISDNRKHYEFQNTPIANLTASVIASLKSHHPVYWEGDMNVKTTELSNICIDKSGALMGNLNEIAEKRQKSLEHFSISDQHAMAIVGISYHTNKNNNAPTLYFICKNSWGKEWGNDGFYYMPLDEFLMSTLFVGIVK